MLSANDYSRRSTHEIYALRALAAILLASAAVLFILRPHDLGIRLLAFLALLLALSLVKRSNILVWRARGDVIAEWASNRSGQVGPLAWTLAAASLVAFGVCYYLLHLDALHGGKQVWPVYALFGAALAVTRAVGYVVVTMFR